MSSTLIYNNLNEYNIKSDFYISIECETEFQLNYLDKVDSLDYHFSETIKKEFTILVCHDKLIFKYNLGELKIKFKINYYDLITNEKNFELYEYNNDLIIMADKSKHLAQLLGIKKNIYRFVLIKEKENFKKFAHLINELMVLNERKINKVEISRVIQKPYDYFLKYLVLTESFQLKKFQLYNTNLKDFETILKFLQIPTSFQTENLIENEKLKLEEPENCFNKNEAEYEPVSPFILQPIKIKNKTNQIQITNIYNKEDNKSKNNNDDDFNLYILNEYLEHIDDDPFEDDSFEYDSTNDIKTYFDNTGHEVINKIVDNNDYNEMADKANDIFTENMMKRVDLNIFIKSIINKVYDNALRIVDEINPDISRSILETSYYPSPALLYDKISNSKPNPNPELMPTPPPISNINQVIIEIPTSKPTPNLPSKPPVLISPSNNFCEYIRAELNLLLALLIISLFYALITFLYFKIKQ